MEDYKIGQVLYYRTHFYRCDVKFFKVLNITPRTLTVVELKSKVVDGDPMRTYHVTLDESMEEIGEPIKAFKNKRGVAHIGKASTWNDTDLEEWDGKPMWADTGFQG